jgi:hypothetical protein
MLKVRYFSLKSDTDGTSLTSVQESARNLNDPNLKIVSSSKSDIVLSYQTVRQVRTISFLEDGSEFAQEYPTIDRYRMRLFKGREQSLILSVIDPPRSGKVIASVLDRLMPEVRTFFEPITFTERLVDQHIQQFEVAKLVSAKIRNFRVYDNAVGRLEISSRAGLLSSIAPFVEGKYYEMESLTYEVISNLTKGLVTYSTNGTVRVSGPIVEAAFTRLESCL